MNADDLARLLEREPDKFRSVLERCHEIGTLARRDSSMPFNDFAESVCNHFNIQLVSPVPERFREYSPFTAFMNPDGRQRIFVHTLNNTIASRIDFYHELGHALLHEADFVGPNYTEGGEKSAESEAWLFAAYCAVSDGRDPSGVVLKFLRESVPKTPVDHMTNPSATFQFFSENWADLSGVTSFEAEGRIVVVNLERRLIEQIAKDPILMRSFDPFRFESLLAELLSGIGYQVQQTKRTRDGGVDIVAIARVHGSALQFLIECKRYAAHRKVDVSLVRSLFGAKTHIGASKAIIATTSRFTEPARAFAEAHKWELELRDLEGISVWVSDYLKIHRP